MAKRIQIGVKLPPETIEKLDALCSSLPYKTTRTAIIETAIDRLLSAELALQTKARAHAPPAPKPMKAGS